MSLSQAAKDLGVERRYLKGFAEASGIVLHPAPPRSLMMSRADLERLRILLGKPGRVIPVAG